MRIAYTTTFDANDIHQWSGTPYHMSRALNKEGMEIEYIGNLKRRLPPFFKIKQFYKEIICQQRESPRFNITAAKNYSEQVAKKLSGLNIDAVISPLINPIAYLDTNKPIILWTDAVYSALVGFYSAFYYHSSNTIHQGNRITSECLSRLRLAIFSSDWAARSAAELYGISYEKIKVVPYGANIDTYPTFDEMKQSLKLRHSNKIKLLFLAKSWERKGGDIACKVAQALHEAGHEVELTIVGYTPTFSTQMSFVNCLGFVSKQTPEGKAKINKLLSESHFLIIPSRADACPMVFAEANAYGLPCITTHVGGIATAVKPNINGMTFGLDAPIAQYCQYIVNTLQNKNIYNELALSSYNEYETRLNWKRASIEIKRLLTEVI
jgi:glycosyltransferase involved in cell wall biosynthesis